MNYSLKICKKLSTFCIGLGLALLASTVGASFAFAGNTAVKSAYIYAERAYVWSKPGYTWRDCAKLENQSDAFNNMEKLLETKSVCNSRVPDMQHPALAGDRVFIQPDGKGGLKYETFPVQIGDAVHQKKFYSVIYDQVDENGKPVIDSDGKQKTFRGWMSEDHLTQVRQEEPLPKNIEAIDIEKTDEPAVADAVPSKKIEPPCPPENNGKPGAKNPIKQAKSQAEQMAELANNQSANVAVNAMDKSPMDINRFACLYRDTAISDQAFPAQLTKVSKAASEAAKAFDVPYGVLMCTFLIESGMHHKPRDRDEYQGYGQFGSGPVEDLRTKVATRDPYARSLASYKSGMSPTGAVSFTDQSVRQSEDPRHAMGATAMMMQWIYRDRLKASKCNECSVDDRMTRRELYLMIAGYNYGPYSIHKYANKTLTEMTTKFPPPKETRNYMTQMDRCMQRGQETKFRVIERPVSREYTDRKKFCDSKYPTKTPTH